MIDEQISSLLEDGEQVHYSGRPVFLPFLLRSLHISCIGIFFLVIPFILALLVTGFLTISAVQNTAWLVFIPFCLVGMAMIFSPVWNYLAYLKTSYVLTNKRVLIASGIFGRDFKSINYENIRNMTVNVSIIDKISGNNTGSIGFFSGEIHSSSQSLHPTSDLFYSVQDCYGVFKLAKSLSDQVAKK